MNLDLWLKNLPFIGVFFERTYAFWSANVGLANATHIILGAGLALFFVTRIKKAGIVLIAIATVIHAVAFFK